MLNGSKNDALTVFDNLCVYISLYMYVDVCIYKCIYKHILRASLTISYDENSADTIYVCANRIVI